MTKIVLESHVTSMKGVNAFESYCLEHKPVILWKEETKNDFGIDGEVELTATNENGKLEATGEIIKIQIKSTLKGSYIRNNNEENFEFIAKKDDLAYWRKHKLDVILIVYFENDKKIYAKKIQKDDFKNANKNIPILFHKEQNELLIGDNKFKQNYSSVFKQRVSFDIKETLISNIFKFSKLPYYIFSFDAKISGFNEIIETLDPGQYPYLTLNSKKIYTFDNLTAYPELRKFAIKSTLPAKERLTYFMQDKDKQKLVIGLINRYFKALCRSMKIYYNKDFRRYYFGLVKEAEDRKIRYRSKKSMFVPRTVVKHQSYYGVDHVRHLGFQTNYFYNDDGLFLSINPKYLFTLDGETPLDDGKLITKLNKGCIQKEFNEHVLNHIHFLHKILADGRNTIILADCNNATISIGANMQFPANFGIPSDNDINYEQGTLF